MRKILGVVLLTATLILTGSPNGYAYRGGHGHGGRGHVGVGVMIGPAWGWGWGVPYYPYPYYPPPVIQREQEENIQPEIPAYWYYCREPEGYYPYVKQCPQGWMKVVPSPPPDSGEPE